MIIVCKDPGNISGSQRYIQNCDHSWQDNLFEIFPDGLDPRDWRVTMNGAEVNPEDFDMAATPAADDVLVLANKPRGVDPFTIGIIAAVALAASAAVYLLTPKYNLGSSASSKTSSNNSFTGQTNLPRAYQAWPDIFGRNRIYPDIISPSVVEYVDNVKTLRHYFWVGRGSHALTDVKYAESDVTDYANSAYTIYGDCIAIPEVIEQFANEAVDGQELLGVNEGTDPGITVTATATTGYYPIDTGIVTATIPYSTAAQAVFDGYSSGYTSVKTQFSTNAFVGNSTLTFSYNSYGTITSFVINKDPKLLAPVSCTISMDISQEPRAPNESLSGHSITISLSEDTTIGPFELSVACTQIWYDVVFLRGLKGTATFTSVWWAVDGSGVEIPGSRQSEDFSYSGTKLDQKYFTRKLTPAYGFGKYRFQIKRTNNADTTNATNQAKLNALYAVRIKTNQVYQMNGFGGTAIVVDSSATENATTSSGMKFNAWGQRKVITCNADGTVNYTLSESRRICDSVVHHMHIDAGVPLSKIDVAGLYAIQESITPAEFGYFDGTFDDADVSLGDRVKAMCNAGRILVNREGSKWVFIRDEAQAYPVATFDRRTTANGDFSLTISPTNSGGKDSVQVQWVDSEDSNTKKYIRLKWDDTNNVPMFGYGASPLQVEITGCTNYAQALDRAELEMRKIVYLRNSVSDVSLNDAEYVWRGERVRWVDVADVSAGSGEVLDVDGSKYTTSEECAFDGVSVYKVCITDEYGYSSAFVTATPRMDGVNGFIATGLPSAVIRNHDDIQLGSRYLLVKEAEVGRHDFVLSSKTPNNDGTFNVELAQYDDRVYLRSLTA